MDVAHGLADLIVRFVLHGITEDRCEDFVEELAQAIQQVIDGAARSARED